MFFSHVTSAKGLVLTSVSCTSALVLWSPGSLTALSSDSSGQFADVMAGLLLVLAAIGWADIIYTDLLGRSIWPTLQPRLRHQFCMLIYSVFAAMYAVLAFVAMDPRVPSSWILIANYLLVSLFSAVLTVAIGQETRHE